MPGEARRVESGLLDQGAQLIAVGTKRIRKRARRLSELCEKRSLGALDFGACLCGRNRREVWMGDGVAAESDSSGQERTSFIPPQDPSPAERAGRIPAVGIAHCLPDEEERRRKAPLLEQRDGDARGIDVAIVEGDNH